MTLRFLRSLWKIITQRMTLFRCRVYRSRDVRTGRPTVPRAEGGAGTLRAGPVGESTCRAARVHCAPGPWGSQRAGRRGYIARRRSGGSRFCATRGLRDWGCMREGRNLLQPLSAWGHGRNKLRPSREERRRVFGRAGARPEAGDETRTGGGFRGWSVRGPRSPRRGGTARERG